MSGAKAPMAARARSGLRGLVIAVSLGVAGMGSGGRAAAPEPVLHLDRSVPIPTVASGDFDHLAVDLAHRRLYTSAQSTHTIEEFDLDSGMHLRSVPASVNPHYIFFAPSIGRIILADGGATPGEPGQIKFIDPATMATVASVPVRYRTDSDLYDAETNRFYSVSAERGGTNSLLTVIDVATRHVIGKAVLPSANVEGMAVDDRRHTLFMNMRDKRAIGVVDLRSNRLVAQWAIPAMNQNTPMAYDPVGRRLFVVGRNPGRVYVIDAQNGRLLSTADCRNDGDDITYDAAGRRLFVSTDEGFVVMARGRGDDLAVVQTGGQRGGKTSVYVPSAARFFVARAAAGGQPAVLDIYQVAR